jgi:hypothetical protein
MGILTDIQPNGRHIDVIKGLSWTGNAVGHACPRSSTEKTPRAPVLYLLCSFFFFFSLSVFFGVCNLATARKATISVRHWESATLECGIDHVGGCGDVVSVCMAACFFVAAKAAVNVAQKYPTRLSDVPRSYNIIVNGDCDVPSPNIKSPRLAVRTRVVKFSNLGEKIWAVRPNPRRISN